MFIFFQASGHLKKENWHFSCGKADFIPIKQVIDSQNGFYNREKKNIRIEVFFSVSNKLLI